jgi:putative ABC transport system permease protein
MLLRRSGEVVARLVPAGASAPTWLAVANMRVFATRFAGVITASAMLIIFSLTYALSQTTLLQATTDSAHDGTLAQHQITGDQLGGVPDDVLDRVRDLDGVRDAATVSTTSVIWPHRVLGDVEVAAEPALILTADAPGVLDLDVRRGSLADLTGRTVAIGQDVAGSRHADLGSTVALTLGDGSAARARVVAVYARSLGLGSVVLSRDLAAGHRTSAFDDSVLVRTDDSRDAADEVSALAASSPGLQVEDTRGDTDGSLTSPTLWLNIATIAVLIGYLALTIANRIAAMTTQRRRELSALRLAGATRRQVLAMTRRESLLAAAMSCVAALAVSALPLAFAGIAFLGHPWPAGPIWLVPAMVVLVVSLIVASVELPVRSLLRSSPLVTDR